MKLTRRSRVAASMATVVAAAFVMRHVYCIAIVRGQSMQPTLFDGERVLVRRARSTRYEVGQVIVFEKARLDMPGNPAWRIKRVAAVAGDPVPYGMVGAESSGVTVPPGYLAVRGDNQRSETSEHIGYVQLDAILGTTRRNYPLPRA